MQKLYSKFGLHIKISSCACNVFLKLVYLFILFIPNFLSWFELAVLVQIYKMQVQLTVTLSIFVCIFVILSLY